jgi:hypothetical protein
MPVSITPGECTYQGHGAEVALTVEHEFPPDFLRSTIRNLIVNDLVDQLGPVVYEVIRSGALEKLETLHQNELRACGQPFAEAHPRTDAEPLRLGRDRAEQRLRTRHRR